MKPYVGLMLMLGLVSLAGARPSPFAAPVGPEQHPPSVTSVPEVAAPDEPEAMPLEQAWAVLRHAPAAQVKAFLAQDPQLLSAQGVALVDARTNRLLLRDSPERVAAMLAIIDALDAPLRQVQLEARIVVARSNQSLEWGMRLGLGGGAQAGLLQNIGDQRLAQHQAPVSLSRAEPFAFAAAQGQVNAGVRGVIPRLDRAFDLQLSALEQQGYAEIVSQPRLLTADGHEAVIASGTTLSFPGAEGGTTFVDALLSMRATPNITADGRIMLQLEVAQDSPAGGSSGTINTNSLKTQVLVGDGETLVLGGVYRFEDVEELSKVPLLGDLPWLGRLFRQTRQATLKNELLIFLTPTILPN